MLTAAGDGDDDDDGPEGDPTPRMLTGDSAGMLGDWEGTNYSHKNAGTGVSNSAVVYTNQAAAVMYPIASRYSVDANIPTTGGDATLPPQER